MKRMELPPGWRGYGAKDYTDHPDTPARQAAGGSGQAKERPDRFALQKRADAVRAPAARTLSREQRAHRRTLPRHSLPPKTTGSHFCTKASGRHSGADPERTGEHPERAKTGQSIKLNILRYNPADPASEPHLQTYELEQSDGMTLFIALNEIREKLDPSLQFDFVCRAGICGSCGMMINGRPGLACRTLTKERRAGHHARAAAGVQADRRSVGRYRQVDARDERAARRPGCT